MTPQSLKFFSLAALFFSIGLIASALGETAQQYIDDAAVAARVKEEIVADTQLRDSHIKIGVLNGEVTLTGDVSDRYQEEEAVEDAESIDGVAPVTDVLSINSQNDDQ